MPETTPVAPFHTPEGQIADPNYAQDIALAGGKAAEERERELIRQHETGLTQEEEVISQVLARIELKYPNAFEKVVDSKGRQVLIVKGPSANVEIYLSEKGFVSVISDYGAATRVPTEQVYGIVDTVMSKKAQVGMGARTLINYDGANQGVYAVVLDIVGSEQTRNTVSALLMKQQLEGEQEKKKRTLFNDKERIAAILDQI